MTLSEIYTAVLLVYGSFVLWTGVSFLHRWRPYDAGRARLGKALFFLLLAASALLGGLNALVGALVVLRGGRIDLARFFLPALLLIVPVILLRITPIRHLWTLRTEATTLQSHGSKPS